MPRLPAALLLLGVAACGSTPRSEPTPAPPRMPSAPTSEAECVRHLVCNAPTCTCPDGYRCELHGGEPRPGCAECVPAVDAERCPPPAPTDPPVLARYDELVAGARRTLDVRYHAATRTWEPATQLGMPMHHASSIDYVGHAWPPAPHDGDTLRLVVVALERVFVQRDPAIRTWFFTYRVRVESACAP